MSQPPATTRTLFPGISSRAWEHPADRTALTALRGLKGFDQILKLLSGVNRFRINEQWTVDCRQSNSG